MNVSLILLPGIHLKSWPVYDMYQLYDVQLVLFPGINLKSWPVYGMYQPGDIQLMTINGVDYIVSANEGKSNDRRCCFKEEIRVKDVDLSEMFGTLLAFLFFVNYLKHSVDIFQKL